MKIEEIEEALAKISPWPWRQGRFEGEISPSGNDDLPDRILFDVNGQGCCWLMGEDGADYKFVIQAPSYVAFLLQRLKEMETIRCYICGDSTGIYNGSRITDGGLDVCHKWMVTRCISCGAFITFGNAPGSASESLK